MERVTIKDIAREAGVSISTVSNALNGVDVLKPETRDQILAVADRLHYIPNLNGRNLKSKATKVIGLFVASLTGPYFATLADSISQACKANGYELNIFVTSDTRSALSNILGRRVDGCVILTEAVDENGAEQIREHGVPTVFLDREIQAKTISSVLFDSYRDGEAAAEFLLSRKSERICFLKGISNNFDSTERWRGFHDCLVRAGKELSPEYILEGGFAREASYDSMKAFLEKGLPLPDAVFAANDLSAFGAMDALAEAGHRVPEDVIVLGVDDIEQCNWYTPTLTTVKTGYETEGALAVRELMKIINGEADGQNLKLRGHLMERESTNK